ncbi:MAG: hypothetical protein PHF55_06345 [Bacteroidales bacterium]|jgi:hypothetical protein|nr:hypothetical protein [Bacteroidales bacterium]MDI3480010.1 hypothetical protein [Rikenellaceae bacterium]MDN5355322.1 hypothetical protein [Rikenellaceae bacterium]
MKRLILFNSLLLLFLSRNNINENRFYYNNFQTNNIKIHTGLINNSQNNNGTPNLLYCKFQNDSIIDLGIGIAVWNYDCNKNIIIYQDSLLKTKVYDFNVCKNDQNYPCPLFYKIDYGIYHFVVINFTKKWCKIIYNGNQYGYIAMDSTFEFVYWDKFLQKYSTGIREKRQNDIFNVNLVKDDTIYAINLVKNTKRNILWRKNNKLLIDIFLLE